MSPSSQRPSSPGLRWRKLDLHVHTPASHDFDDKSITPEQFIDAACSRVDGIAVTDHNSGEWIDKVKAAARGKLQIIPGVEVTATGGKEGGIHIIALFGPEATTKTVENLLGALGIRADKYGKADAFTSLSPNEVVDKISEQGGLATLAHADSSRGLLHDSRGASRIQVMCNPRLSGVEARDVGKYKTLLDGSDRDYRRKLAVYRASDNPAKEPGYHSVDGIGTRYSLFKMEEFTLESLRQCLLDPDVRIRTDADALSLEFSYPRVVSVEFNGGFLHGQTFEFHEGLNSVIGGKGVGKSLLVEFIRFALDQPSAIASIRKDYEGKLQDQLQVGGRIVVVVQLATADRLVVRRTYDGSSNPQEVWDHATGNPIQGRLSDIFPILAYSQTEAIEIAKDEAAQLKLIDSFVDTVAIVRDVERTGEKLARLNKRLAQALEARTELEGKRKDLATSREQIKAINKILKSPRFSQLEALEPKTQYLSELEMMVEDIENTLQSFDEATSSVSRPSVPRGYARDSDVRELEKETNRAFAAVERATGEIRLGLERVTKNLDKVLKQWTKRVEKATAEYKEWLTEAGGDKNQLLQRREKLVREEGKVKRELERLEKQSGSLTDLKRERSELLDELDRLHAELYELRKAKYEQITKECMGRVRLEIQRGEHRVAFREMLMTLKRGSRVKERDIDELVANVTPRKLVDCVITGDKDGLAKASGLDLGRAERLIETLRSVEDLSDLLSLQHKAYPEDLPRLSFQKDDLQYYDLASLSVGQKCTVLLMIALAEGDMPVIIDQPEDALDIPSVYEDVTLRLRVKKDRRQFILTTHNATVAVGGDSDKFHVLRGTATKGEVEVGGAIDGLDVRGRVIKHLEGGEDSFRLKRRKYGITDD